MNYDVEEKLSNGNTIYYRIYGGTYYEVGIKLADGTVEDYASVNEGLMKVLKKYENYPRRVRIWYGDRQTGESWNDEYDVTGTIGRTNGQIKIPIILNNKRSLGGPALLVGSIIRVDDIEGKKTLWKVSGFHVSPMEIILFPEQKDYPYAVMQNEDNGVRVNVANFKTENQAQRWIDFMNGKRYSK